jgi:hypothetical protein
VEFVKLEPVTQTVVQDMLRRAAEEQHSQRREEAERKQAEEEQRREQARLQKLARQPVEEPVVTQVVKEPLDGTVIPVSQVNQTESKPTPPTTPAAAKPTPPRPAGRLRVIVLANDESGSPWTTHVTVKGIERALIQLPNVQTLRRSELAQNVNEELSTLGPQDITRLGEIARGLDAQYVALGTCLEARHDGTKFFITVHFQILDTHTGEITYSQGFDAWEYGMAIGAPAGEVERVYEKKVGGLADLFFSGRSKLTPQ